MKWKFSGQFFPYNLSEINRDNGIFTRERLLKVIILPLISEVAKESQTVKVLKSNHSTENSRNSGKQNFQGEILGKFGIF